MTSILIVEDNEINREVLRRRLERRGYMVYLAENGEEAIAQATGQSPDLILMDLNLPILDGWEATRRIKSSSNASLPRSNA